MSQAFLSYQGIHKSFGDKRVLSGLDLHIARGESVVLIGQSGTGKSVTLKCFLGLLQPDQGDIHLDGKTVLGLNAQKRKQQMDRIGMLFQGAALFDSLSVWRNIGFRLLSNGLRAAEVRKSVDKLLDDVGLESKIGDLSPSDLSGGMQKRVGLARALASEPEILLFDEPTTGLDPISGAQINELIADLGRNRGATTLTITHDLSSARLIADRVVLIHAGKVVWMGDPDQLSTDPDPHLRQFVDGIASGPLTNG